MAKRKYQIKSDYDIFSIDIAINTSRKDTIQVVMNSILATEDLPHHKDEAIYDYWVAEILVPNIIDVLVENHYLNEGCVDLIHPLCGRDNFVGMVKHFTNGMFEVKITSHIHEIGSFEMIRL